MYARSINQVATSRKAIARMCQNPPPSPHKLCYIWERFVMLGGGSRVHSPRATAFVRLWSGEFRQSWSSLTCGDTQSVSRTCARFCAAAEMLHYEMWCDVVSYLPCKRERKYWTCVIIRCFEIKMNPNKCHFSSHICSISSHVCIVKVMRANKVRRP